MDSDPVGHKVASNMVRASTRVPAEGLDNMHQTLRPDLVLHGSHLSICPRLFD